MWPPASPPYHFPICTSSRFGTPACTRSAGFSIVCTSPPAYFVPMTVAPVDPPERLLHLREPVVDDRLVAVDREAHRPAPEAELRADPLDRLLGEDAFAVVPVRAVGEHGGCGDGAEDHRVAGDRAAEHQLAQRVDHRPEVVVTRHHHPARQVALRLGHQPDAHLRDDAEVRLEEEAVERRPEAPLVDVPGAAVRDGARAGAHELAVREHDLQAAGVGRVLAVRRVPDAVLERVADHAAPAEVRHRDPQLVARRRAPPRTARRSSRRARPPRTRRRRRSRARGSSGAG